MTMTYRELLALLKKMPKNKLDDDVTITIYDEFYGVRCAGYADESTNDVLDNGHMFLIVNQDGEA